METNVIIPENPPLHFSAMIKLAWQMLRGFKRYIWLIVLYFIIPMFLLVWINGLMYRLFPILSHSVIYLLGILIVFSLIWGASTAGSYFIALQWIKGNPINKNSWLKGLRFTWQIALVMLIMQIVIRLGTIIPMVFPQISKETFTWIKPFSSLVYLILSILLLFAPMIIIDQGKNILSACGLSIKLFFSHPFLVLGIYVFLMVAMLLSTVLLLVGLAWTLPFSMLLNITLYYAIQAQQK